MKNEFIYSANLKSFVISETLKNLSENDNSLPRMYFSCINMLAIYD